jgi:neutral amino acid transport system ATP-binding protein
VKGLRELGMSVLFVEHDMDVVMDISDWVVCMAEGRVIAEGPPESIGKNRAVIDAYLGGQHEDPVEVRSIEENRAADEALIARAEAEEDTA